MPDEPTPLISFEHSNQIQLSDETKTLTCATYIDETLMITQGQQASPPPAITCSPSKFFNLIEITLNAGRQNSTPVAEAFVSISGGVGHVFSPGNPVNPAPGQLNFYFAVELQYQSQGVPGSVVVLLGQGSNAGGNNWWIGGKCISITQNQLGQLNLPLNNGDTLTLMLTGGDYIFNFTPNVPPAASMR